MLRKTCPEQIFNEVTSNAVKMHITSYAVDYHEKSAKSSRISLPGPSACQSLRQIAYDPGNEVEIKPYSCK